MASPLIRFCDVAFSFEPGRTVLDSVDLELNRGDRIALLGANGCGKTTLLHLAVGLLRPQRGRIEAFGKVRETEKDFLEVRRRAGLLFQDPDDQLFCPTVVEDIAFGPMNLGSSREEMKLVVRETLDLLGLDGYQERITYKLSGGEKRLISLAAVLAMKPDVLLLDEPTCGLDEATEDRIVEILDRLDQAMILVSHEKPFLSRLTQKAFVFQGGKLQPCCMSRTRKTLKR